MKPWLQAWIISFTIFLSIVVCILGYKIDELGIELNDVREELVKTENTCHHLKNEVYMWERLNDATLFLLSNGGWDD